MLTWRCQPCEEKSVAAVVARSQQIAVPCGASQIFGKIAAIRRPARIPVQKIIHLCPPPARDDRADRKSVVQGKSVSVRVDLGGRRSIKKKINKRRQIHK